MTIEPAITTPDRSPQSDSITEPTEIEESDNPKKRPHPEQPEEAEKLAARREANRVHAFKSRQRSKALLQELQRTVEILNGEKSELERENAVLRAQVEVLRQQNLALTQSQRLLLIRGAGQAAASFAGVIPGAPAPAAGVQAQSYSYSGQQQQQQHPQVQQQDTQPAGTTGNQTRLSVMMHQQPLLPNQQQQQQQQPLMDNSQHGQQTMASNQQQLGDDASKMLTRGSSVAQQAAQFHNLHTAQFQQFLHHQQQQLQQHQQHQGHDQGMNNTRSPSSMTNSSPGSSVTNGV